MTPFVGTAILGCTTVCGKAHAVMRHLMDGNVSIIPKLVCHKSVETITVDWSAADRDVVAGKHLYVPELVKWKKFR